MTTDISVASPAAMDAEWLDPACVAVGSPHTNLQQPSAMDVESIDSASVAGGRGDRRTITVRPQTHLDVTPSQVEPQYAPPQDAQSLRHDVVV